MKSGTAILWVISLIVVACLGFVAGARHVRREPGRVSVATVNGEVITQAEFDSALRLVVGQEILRLLCAQKAVMQEAKKLGISASENEVENVRRSGQGLTYGTFKLPDEATQDPAMRDIVNQEVRAGILMRKMILKDVSESWKRHIYDLFKEELTQYELFCILVPSQAEADVVSAKLQKGDSFSDLAASYSGEENSKKNGGRLGFLTQPALQTLLGPAALEAVVDLKPGFVSKPVPTPIGFVFLKVGAIRSSYDELKPTIETIFVESKQLEALQELISDADMVSPFGAKIKLHGTTPTPKPASSPVKK